MSRETYQLTDETRAVLTDKVIPIASEMDVNESYLYQLLSGVGNDCFSKFRRLFSAAVRAGADVTPWMASLNAIQARHSVKLLEVCPSLTLAENIGLHARKTGEMVTALKDGHIDDRERTAILNAIQREKNSLETLIAVIEKPTNGSIPPIRMGARAAVEKRRS